MIRVKMSVGPPAPKGAIILTVREGYRSAASARLPSADAAPTIVKSIARRFNGITYLECERFRAFAASDGTIEGALRLCQLRCSAVLSPLVDAVECRLATLYALR